MDNMTYEDKLHDKARDLMEELDEKYGWDNMISLDEYLYEYFDNLEYIIISGTNNIRKVPFVLPTTAPRAPATEE